MDDPSSVPRRDTRADGSCSGTGAGVSSEVRGRNTEAGPTKVGSQVETAYGPDAFAFRPTSFANSKHPQKERNRHPPIFGRFAPCRPGDPLPILFLLPLTRSRR